MYSGWLVLFTKTTSLSQKLFRERRWHNCCLNPIERLTSNPSILSWESGPSWTTERENILTYYIAILTTYKQIIKHKKWSYNFIHRELIIGSVLKAKNMTIIYWHLVSADPDPRGNTTLTSLQNVNTALSVNCAYIIILLYGLYYNIW